MSLYDLNLDDLEFQNDFVDKARLQIIQHAPEWTDYNVSDPGITLIELFAWMAEQLNFRLNQVPDENLIKLLQLLGGEPTPIQRAVADLTFYLSLPFPMRVKLIDKEKEKKQEQEQEQAKEANYKTQNIQIGTEVTTRSTEQKKAITFTTEKELVIRSVRLVHLLRAHENRHYLYSDYLEASQQSQQMVTFKDGQEFVPFQERPQKGDAFYLGFYPKENIDGHVLHLCFYTKKKEQSRDSTNEEVISPTFSINKKEILVTEPLLEWECLVEEDKGNDEDKGKWVKVKVSRHLGEEDDTPDFQKRSIVLYLPSSLKVGKVHGYPGYWLRASYKPRDSEQGEYSESPRFKKIEILTLGATVRASNTMVVENEILGPSNGEPGQVFKLEHAPLPKLKHKIFKIEQGKFHEKEVEDEYIELEVEEKMGFMRWQKVKDFARSSRHARHFMLEAGKGEIRFGAAIRQPDGRLEQYGRIPEPGYQIRVLRYRYGGGYRGNVQARQLEVLKTEKRPMKYIDRVTNLEKAQGGKDQEELPQAIMRVLEQISRQPRAVTVKDYENLALHHFENQIKRAKCYTNSQSKELGVIELLVVPNVPEAVEHGDLSKLQLSDQLRQDIKEKIANYLILTTTLEVRAPRYLGVQVIATIVAEDWIRKEELEKNVKKRLNGFLTPLSNPTPKNQPERASKESSASLSEREEKHQNGWPFGEALYVSDIHALLQKEPGVKYVKEIKLRRRDVYPTVETGHFESANDKMSDVNKRVLSIRDDTLICSLQHDIQFAQS